MPRSLVKRTGESQVFKCQFCSKDFYLSDYQLRKVRKRYQRDPMFCSRSCTGRGKRLGSVGVKVVECLVCRKKLRRYGFRSIRGRKFACGKECRVALRRLRKAMRCALCEKQFERVPHRIRYSKTYCSRRCSDMALSFGLRDRKLIYTPALLHMLAVYKGSRCGLPGCPNPRTRLSVWHVCGYHSRLLGSALRNRQRKRSTLLAKISAE